MSSVTQLDPTLCNPVDCSLAGSSAHGIFQARKLEWVVISFSRGSSRPRDQTKVFLQCRKPRFDPLVRKIPWRRKWQPTPVFLPGESHGQRSLVGYSPWGRKESDTTERLHFLSLCIVDSILRLLLYFPQYLENYVHCCIISIQLIEKTNE